MQVLSRGTLLSARPYKNPIDNFSGEIKSQMKKNHTNNNKRIIKSGSLQNQETEKFDSQDVQILEL